MRRSTIALVPGSTRVAAAPSSPKIVNVVAVVSAPGLLAMPPLISTNSGRSTALPERAAGACANAGELAVGMPIAAGAAGASGFIVFVIVGIVRVVLVDGGGRHVPA